MKHIHNIKPTSYDSAPLWPKRLMELKNVPDYNLCNLELSLVLTLDLFIWQV